MYREDRRDMDTDKYEDFFYTDDYVPSPVADVASESLYTVERISICDDTVETVDWYLITHAAWIELLSLYSPSRYRFSNGTCTFQDKPRGREKCEDQGIEYFTLSFPHEERPRCCRVFYISIYSSSHSFYDVPRHLFIPL